jgi:hypothetical protein
MVVEPGELVVGYFWEKARPLLVLDVNLAEGKCIVAPFTSKIKSQTVLRRQLRLYEAVVVKDKLLGRDESILKIRCARNYNPDYLHKKIGSLSKPQWTVVKEMRQRYLRSCESKRQAERRLCRDMSE